MKIHDILANLRRASSDTQRSTVSLVAEMLKLRYGRGRVGGIDYFTFRLYDPALTDSDKKAFGGYRVQDVLADILIDDRSRIFGDDKVTSFAVLTALGFPVPRIKAVYGSGRRASPFVSLESHDDLIAYLQTPGNLPVYLKPAWGSYGRGNTVVQRCEDGRIALSNGFTVDAKEYCRGLDNTTFALGASTAPAGRAPRRPFGWLLQEVLSAHREIAAVSGDRISGLRIHTFLTPRGPLIHRAIWKVNVGTKDSDNFQHGASGNLAAALNVEDGTVVRVVSGVGFNQKVNPAHPVSGKPLLGFRLPEWQRIRQVVLDASTNIPGWICQGWDVAVCDDGPRLLEVNPLGDLDLSQHAYGRGFIDDAFLALLRERGLEDLISGGNAVWRKSPTTGRRGRRKQHWTW